MAQRQAIRPVLTLILLGALVTGCGSAAKTDSTRPVYADTTVFDRGLTANSIVDPTPGVAARRQPIVMVGTIAGVADGRSLVRELIDGSEEHDRFVVIKVKISEVLKGKPGLFPNGFAYLTRPRGIDAYDAQGLLRGGGAAVPISDLERALPVGTQLLVMAPVAKDPFWETDKTLNRDAGIEEVGATVLNVYNNQSLLLDGGPMSFVRGWPQETFPFEESLQEVREALKRQG